MERDKDIKAQLEELYGITDEGEIVELTDLEGRAEVPEKDDVCEIADWCCNSARDIFENRVLAEGQVCKW